MQARLRDSLRWGSPSFYVPTGLRNYNGYVSRGAKKPPVRQCPLDRYYGVKLLWSLFRAFICSVWAWLGNISILLVLCAHVIYGFPGQRESNADFFRGCLHNQLLNKQSICRWHSNDVRCKNLIIYTHFNTALGTIFHIPYLYLDQQLPLFWTRTQSIVAVLWQFQHILRDIELCGLFGLLIIHWNKETSDGVCTSRRQRSSSLCLHEPEANCFPSTVIYYCLCLHQ